MVDTDLPVVISCQGATPSARLAAEAADAFEQVEEAEALHDVDAAIAAARAGRPVIAFDGCGSACCSRVLEAKGVRPRAALNLTAVRETIEPGASEDPRRVAAQASLRLRSHPVARPPRPRRPARPAPTAAPRRPHTVDDYLLAIDALASTTVDCGAIGAETPILAAHISVALGISRASAGEMLARLETTGLVQRSGRKEVLLTRAGRAAADLALARHRVLERLVSDFLGYPLAECYERARLLAEAFDDAGIERARIALGQPERCPHGWPIDPAQAREESLGLTTLAALGEGQSATVVRIAEHDGPLLGALTALGLEPEARLTVGRREATGIPVDLDGARRDLAPNAASAIFVRCS